MPTFSSKGVSAGNDKGACEDLCKFRETDLEADV